MNFTQVEPEYTYEIPSLRRDNSDEAMITAATAFTLLVAVVIALVYWGVILWRLPSKAGYKGAAQWIWFLLLYFPLTGGLALLAFVFAPWPVKRQLEKSESQLDELRRLTDQPRCRAVEDGSVEDELERMRRQMHRQ